MTAFIMHGSFQDIARLLRHSRAQLPEAVQLMSTLDEMLGLHDIGIEFCNNNCNEGLIGIYPTGSAQPIVFIRVDMDEIELFVVSEAPPMHTQN